MYRPSVAFNVPMKLQIPTWEKINGVRQKVYPNVDDIPDDLIIFGNFRTFGGTETTINGVYSIESTATVETYYRPDVTADCRVVLLNTNEIYEIIGEPENIEKRNRLLKFKVRKIAGKP